MSMISSIYILIDQITISHVVSLFKDSMRDQYSLLETIEF